MFAPRTTIAAGLLIGVVGYVYDEYYHAANLSLVPIDPLTLLRVHAGIYLGLLIVLLTAIAVLLRPQTTAQLPRLGFGIVLIGAVTELFGAGADMYTHANGYELEIYHNLQYLGAGLTILGYVVLEITAFRERSLAARR